MFEVSVQCICKTDSITNRVFVCQILVKRI